MRKRFLEFHLRKFHFQSQRVGDAVGEVGDAGQQVQVNDLGVGEVLFQGREVSVGDIVRVFRELLDVAQGGLFFRGEAGDVAFLEGLPVVGGESGSLRRSEMVLGSIVALVEKRHAQVDEFGELAVERTSDARVES